MSIALRSGAAAGSASGAVISALWRLFSSSAPSVPAVPQALVEECLCGLGDVVDTWAEVFEAAYKLLPNSALVFVGVFLLIGFWVFSLIIAVVGGYYIHSLVGTLPLPSPVHRARLAGYLR